MAPNGDNDTEEGMETFKDLLTRKAQGSSWCLSPLQPHQASAASSTNGGTAGQDARLRQRTERGHVEIDGEMEKDEQDRRRKVRSPATPPGMAGVPTPNRDRGVSPSQESDYGRKSGRGPPKDPNNKGKGKGKGKGGGRRGGRGRPKKHTNDQAFLPSDTNPKMMALLTIMLKNQLQITQTCRRMEGAIMDTIMTKVTLGLYILVKRVQAAFGKKVEDYREALLCDPNAAPPGSPVADFFMTFVEGLVVMDIGADRREEVQAIIKEINDSAPHQRAWIERRVSVFQISVTANKENAKFTICFRDEYLRKHILDACARMPRTFDIKHGAAPPGWMEDELQCWLEGLLGRE